jgi:predicted Zn-dependent protease
MEAALEALRDAVECSPDYVLGRVSYAVVMARSGDSERAAQLLRAGLARSPANRRDQALLWRTLGDLLLASGDYAGADAAYAQVAEVLPGLPITSRVARTRGRMGRYAESFAMLLQLTEPAAAASVAASSRQGTRKP